jgi:uncharacterized repeat protein (TIGR01451 family)
MKQRAFIMTLVVSATLPLAAATRLVTTSGSDSGNCTVVACATISYAIGQASNGDTISVGPGTFASGSINVNKSVSLRGVQAGVDARSRVAAESVLAALVVLSADNATIDGFKVANGASGDGIVSSSSFSGYQILNNIITQNANGVAFGSSGAIQSILRFNDIFANFIGFGVYTPSFLTNAVIDQNRLGSAPGAAQILITSITTPGSVSITNNVFTDQHGSAVSLGNNSGTVISGNTVSGNGGFNLLGGDVNVAISGNTVTASGPAVSIQDNQTGYGPNGSVTVTGNTFVGGGVWTGSGNAVPVEVHFNRIVGGGPAFSTVAASAVIHGENNWFGCNGGPAACATNSIFPGSVVDLDPWIVMDIAAAPSSISLLQTSTVTTDFNQNSDGAAISGFPNGTTVAFSATGGSAAPGAGNTSGGAASTTFTPNGTAPATVSATLDAQTVTVSLSVLADVGITGSVGGPAFVSLPVTIYLTVTNSGPDAATNVTITDTLPAGTALNAATPSAGSCSGTGPVVCTLGTLAAGGTVTITLSITPTVAGSKSNSATVTSASDPNGANNTALQTFTVAPADQIPTLSAMILALLAVTFGAIALLRFAEA